MELALEFFSQAHGLSVISYSIDRYQWLIKGVCLNPLPTSFFKYPVKMKYFIFMGYLRRIRVVLAKFWGESIRPILVGRFGCESFRPLVILAHVGEWGTLHM